MFGEKLDRKVSQIDETDVIEDSSVLTENVGAEARRKLTVDTIISDANRGARQALDKCTSLKVNGDTWRSVHSARHANRDRDFEMLAASFCCKVYYTMLPSKNMTSQVPRCLFGKPNSRETIEMLHEALDLERSRFRSRWGVDPSSEDKENNYQRRNNEKNDHSPSKKRSNPYSRQTSIHDYWRARKMCEVNKKPLTASTDVSKHQNVESSKTTKTSTTTTAMTTTATKTTQKMTSN
ncbi:hypothetical protein DMN91_003727 [Ooceraea biroi]|uniref:Uncharacterized protein n=1 Tax=Ooceraea biroi TaxID=2015173 RepID=A0A026W6H2_OOCBI|nr:uncharacterized protein LOC105283584 [Ooceraea biroi]EZA50614.1 hypothetical protein X777_10965 [Ooceraea biroi]RLU23522.1 hypothetical protein DMN91_003727 [Ooceraea biroi]